MHIGRAKKTSISRVILLYCVALTAAIAFGLSVGVVPWMMFSANLGLGLIGITVGAYAAGGITARLALGRLVNRQPPTSILPLAATVLFTSILLYLLPFDFWWLAKAVQGAATATIYMVVFGWAGRSASAEQRSMRLGMLGAFVSFPAVICPVVGVELARYTNGYVLAAALGSAGIALLSAGLLTLTKDDAFELKPPSESGGRAGLPWLSMAALILATAPLGVFESLMPLISGRLPSMNPGALYFAFGVALALGRLLGGWASGRFGAGYMSGIGGLLSAICLLAGASSGLANHSAIILASSAGLTVGLTVSALFADISNRTSNERQASTMGIAGIFHDAGIASGAMLIGTAASSPERAISLSGAAAIAIPLLLLASSDWRRERDDRQMPRPPAR
ncbi:MAG: MFS transporter [Novosphingobium sp.]